MTIVANLTCRIKNYIQPFERELALLELEALVSGPVRPLDGDAQTAGVFEVAGTADAPSAA